MTPRILVLAFALALSGCATQAPPPGPSKAFTSDTSSTAKSAEGSSFENPIIINAEGEAAGVRAEHIWIRTHMPGARLVSQWLVAHGNKMFDVIEVQLPDDSVHRLYFDISGYFGKF